MKSGVVLLVHERIVRSVVTNGVTVDAPWSHGIVEHGVEDRAVVFTPLDAVVRAGDLVGQVGAAVEVPDFECVDLVAFGVGGVREPGLVRAELRGAQGEVIVPLGQHVVVEVHLLV